jgi:hypothetical protein
VNYTSYRDDAVVTAAALVNHLTPGIDGTRPYVVPPEPRARRTRARQITALAGGRLSPDDLDGLVALASRLRPVFEHCDAGEVDAAAKLINDLLRTYRSAPELSRHDGEPWHLHFHPAHAGVPEGWGAGCATGLAMVVGMGDADRIGVCTAPPCDRVFVDTSRNGNRRFCSPRCANRAAVAAFRARERSTR